ncbi:MAG: cytochrome C biogenesis protein [Chloroflexi bacterium]|nr:MAG: cytochrome C biogenesis protein [Chloroflexota bacterium]TME88898.1 MAG: cytochrome C biogenesis protein [Chloroflexota bacterium]
MGRNPRSLRARVRGPRPYHRPCGHRMIETTAAPFPTIRVRPWLGRLAVASSLIATFMALVWAPTDAVQGDVYRIIYVHVPLAWLAYLAFFVVFLASLGWLWTKRPWFDALAVASAEVGVLFTGMFIVAGSIWAKPTWGVWWTWDPRLVTTAIMFMMYVGYLLLRSLSTDFSRRATRAAVIGVIAVIDIPIVHLSVLWMNSLHQLPTVLRAGGSPSLDAAMGMTLGICVVAFTLVYFAFLAERMSIELDRQRRMLEARA